jgi:hypothetical protein
MKIFGKTIADWKTWVSTQSLYYREGIIGFAIGFVVGIILF